MTDGPNWLPMEKQEAKDKYGCEILIDNGNLNQVSTKDAPNDAKIVEYEFEGNICYDLTRSQKDVNIFNMYYDKFGSVKGIRFGCGTYNPKLWGTKQPPENKKRK